VPFNYFSLVWAIALGFLVWGDIPSATLGPVFSWYFDAGMTNRRRNENGWESVAERGFFYGNAVRFGIHKSSIV
jgi:hypothetical protein